MSERADTKLLGEMDVQSHDCTALCEKVWNKTEMSTYTVGAAYEALKAGKMSVGSAESIDKQATFMQILLSPTIQGLCS